MVGDRKKVGGLYCPDKDARRWLRETRRVINRNFGGPYLNVGAVFVDCLIILVGTVLAIYFRSPLYLLLWLFCFATGKYFIRGEDNGVC